MRTSRLLPTIEANPQKVYLDCKMFIIRSIKTNKCDVVRAEFTELWSIGVVVVVKSL